MFKKVSVSLAIVLTLFVVLGLGTYVEANEVENELLEGHKHIASVENYTLYLENEIQKNPEASEILEQFKNLSRHEQQLFIKALAPDNYIKVIEKAIHAKEGEKVSITIDNVKIPISSGKLFQYKEIKDDFTMASNPKWVKVKQDIALFGINLTSFYTSIQFNHDGTHATRALSSTQGHRNWNPAMIVSPRGTGTPYISGGVAYATGSWTIGASPTAGLFYNEDAELSVRANAFNQSKKMWSTLDKWCVDWTRTENVY